MFFGIGPVELAAIALIAVIIFGPDKLPKLIQDMSRMIRKLREFSDSAKEGIREELGPEFRHFEFEDLNPKAFVRKNLLNNDDLGLQEIRKSFDCKDELTTLADAVQESSRTVHSATAADGASTLNDPEPPALGERLPFDGGEERSG